MHHPLMISEEYACRRIDEKCDRVSGVLSLMDMFYLSAIVNIFKQGKENKVSLITGWNEDEGLMFGPPKKAVDFIKEANEKYGADAQTFLKFYPADNDSIAAISQLKLSRDMIFGVHNYTWANIREWIKDHPYLSIALSVNLLQPVSM